jgi:hypothetical protein
VTHHIRFAAGPFHFIERPQLFSIGVQLCLDFSPLQTFMAVQIFLKTGFQRSEQFFPLFWGQLLFIASNVFYTFTSSASANTF